MTTYLTVNKTGSHVTVLVRWEEVTLVGIVEKLKRESSRGKNDLATNSNHKNN
jgi:hypothetical protein